MNIFKTVCVLVFFVITIDGFSQQRERIYLLFCNSEVFPRAYYASAFKGREAEIGTFELEKVKKNDCPSNGFSFFKRISDKSIISVNIDTLKHLITSQWVAHQYDSTLIRLFNKKDIYIIPKDSLKNNKGKAFLVYYQHCEIE